ncbi:MAG: hypothetical protein U0793_07625 [Gemmataceae bacterium]
MMLHRTQICLEDWQYQALKAQSEQSGRSLSDLLREILSKHLKRKSGRARLAQIEGFVSDADSSGADHDDILYGGKAP